MEHAVVLEFDPGTRHYTATVPGIPAIIVDAKSRKAAIKLAGEAIQFYRDEAGQTMPSEVVTVDV